MNSHPLDSSLIPTLARLLSGADLPASVPEEGWDGLIALALDHGVGGVLLRSLRQASPPGADSPRWQPLVAAARRNGRRSLLLEKARRQASAVLDRAGIPAIWLKGAALAYSVYPEPHLRPMDDLDLLVRAGQYDQAREALLVAGFQPAETDFFALGGFTGQARHHEGLTDPTGQVRLELHFRLLIPSSRCQMDKRQMEWFWSQAGEVNGPGARYQGLQPEANLLYLCAHTFLQDQGERLNLLHLLDLHLLILQSKIDWDVVVDHAADLRWTGAVETAARLLAGLFGTPVPAGLADVLSRRRREDEIVPPADAHDIRRWEDWRSAFRCMSAGQRMRLVWVTLFPPREFVRQRYRLAPGEPLVKHYFIHFLDGSREVLRALRGKISRGSRPEPRARV